MKSFWLSLLLFVLLMCSCKTKEVARKTNIHERYRSDISALNEQAKQDTTKTKIIEQTEEFTRITETEIITEYDTEKQTPSKVTEKKKVTESGKQTKTDKTENRGLTDVKKDSTNHLLDGTKMIEAKEEVKEESATSSFWKELGKWCGIGALLVALVLYIKRKLS